MRDEENKTTALVPFGKYKGQPIELLLADQPYLDWLTSQDWFRQKYQNIYTVVINYPGRPVETPEHNRMQVKFLSREYQLKLAFLLVGNRLFRWDQSYFDQFIKTFLEDAKDKLALAPYGKTPNYLSRYLKKPLSELDGIKLLTISTSEFEDKGADVSYELSYGYGKDFSISGEAADAERCAPELFRRLWDCETSVRLRIELKSSVGDDFPAVLRQMKTDRSNVLVLQAYKGTGASWDEFEKYFASQGIRVVLETDIDRIALPRFDYILRVNIEELGLGGE